MFTQSRHLIWTLLLLMVLSLRITPATAQPCPHDGDVNQDEMRTPADALLTFQHFLGLVDPPLDACQQDRANVDDPENSDITPADALCIFQKFLGLSSCFEPVENGLFVLDESPLDDPRFRLQ